MKKILIVSLVSTVALLVSACAPKLGGSDYNVRGVGEISQTLRGTVISARPVIINASDNSQFGAGAGIGGLSGALLGSQIGGGKGRVLTGTLGALGGAAAGHLIQQKATEQEGMEYQVQLDRGDVITISQGAEPRISSGQRVLVIQSNKERSRIVPDTTR